MTLSATFTHLTSPSSSSKFYYTAALPPFTIASHHFLFPEPLLMISISHPYHLLLKFVINSSSPLVHHSLQSLLPISLTISHSPLALFQHLPTHPSSSSVFTLFSSPVCIFKVHSKPSSPTYLQFYPNYSHPTLYNMQ